MAALQKAIDVIAAAEIRDGLLVHEGRNLTSEDLIYAVESRPARERQQHRGLDLLRRPGVGGPAPDGERRHSCRSADRARHLPVRQAHPLLGRHDPHRRARHAAPGGDADVGRGARGAAGRPRRGATRAPTVATSTSRAARSSSSTATARSPKPYRDIQSDARFIHGTGPRARPGDPRVPADQRGRRGPRGRRRHHRRTGAVRPAPRRASASRTSWSSPRPAAGT